jgi:hypothetical protein
MMRTNYEVSHLSDFLCFLLTSLNMKVYIEQGNCPSQMGKLGTFPHVINSRKSVHYVNFAASVILQVCIK